MNALQYMKNVGKSVKYVGIDALKNYNPTTVGLADSAKDLASDLYQSIKDFKGTYIDESSEKSLVGLVKSTVADMRTSITEDIKSGKFYNEERSNKAISSMMDDMMDGFDFSGDDFGDFDFDFDDDSDNSGSNDNSATSELKAELSSDEQNTKEMIMSMDVVGRRSSQQISMSSIKSAEYIVAAQQESSRAIYSMASKGFNQVSTGLAAINANISNLVQLGVPLTAHMQNSTEYFKHSTDFEDKTIKFLEQIAKNTAPSGPDAVKGKGPKYTYDSLISGGILDLRAYMEMVAENVKEMTSIFGSLVGMGGGAKSMSKMITSSPIASLMSFGLSKVMPKVLSDAMKSFDDSLNGFIGSFLEKHKKKSHDGFFGNMFDMIKDMIIPDSGYKRRIDPSKYNHGKVDWDGESRQALMKVIPYQLSQIVSALTGRPLEEYDYNTGKWIKRSEIQNEFDKFKTRSAASAGGDYIYYMKDSARNLKNSKKMSDKDFKRYMEQIDKYNTEAFHSDDVKYQDIDKDNFDYQSFGLDKDVWEYMRSYNKALARKGKSGQRLKYSSDIATGKAYYGNKMRNLEASGSIYTSLFDESIKESEKAPALLGRDDHNNDIFFYLQGIYQFTGYVADNLEMLTPRGSGRFKGKDIPNKGKLKPMRSFAYTRNSSEEDKNSANSKYENSNVTTNFSSVDVDEAASSALDIVNKYSKYSKDVKQYLERKELEPNYSDDILEAKYNKEKQILELSSKPKNELNKITSKLSESVANLLNVPINAVTGFLNSAQVSMTRAIYGNESTKEKGIKDYVGDSIKGLFDKINEKIDDLVPPEVKDAMKSIWNAVAGNKGDDGKRHGGVLSGLVNSASEQLKNAGKWVKGVFTGNAARGRRITKTGLVAVSEGEMIVPAEYNPYYRKAINKQQQIFNERKAANLYFGNYDDGGVPIDENGNIKSDAKGKGKAVKDDSVLGKAGSYLGQGASAIYKGVSQFMKQIMPGGGKDDTKKAVDKEKKTLGSAIKKALTGDDKESYDAKGGAAAGAIIGGGVSLLTGSIIGPIAGAGIGAAAGLIVKSKAVQNVLFGKFNAESGMKEGGILPKQVSEFMQKRIPTMAKGSVVGGTAGLFLGSPVMGAILGSAAGYVSSSEKAKTFLFGEEDKENGGRKGGLVSKKIQDEIKKRVPGMAAGTIAGLVVGPLPGIIPNIILGTTIGYAASGDRFQKFLFGDPNDPKKKGLAGTLKDQLFSPLVGIFTKLAESMKVNLRATVNNLEKSIRGFILKRLGGKIKNSRVGMAIGSKLKGIGSAIGSHIKNPLKGMNDALGRGALNKGYSYFDLEKGRNLTAVERQQQREAYGMDQDSVGGAFDEILANVKSKEELNDLNTVIQQMKDPKKAYENKYIEIRKKIYNIIKPFEKDLEYGKAIKKFYSLVNSRKSDNLTKAYAMISGLNCISDSNKTDVATYIKILQSILADIENVSKDTNSAKKKLFEQSTFGQNHAGAFKKIKDADIMNFGDLVKDEGNRFSDENLAKQKEDSMQSAVISIPGLIADLIAVTVNKDNAEDVMKRLKTSGASAEVQKIADAADKNSGRRTTTHMEVNANGEFEAVEDVNSNYGNFNGTSTDANGVKTRTLEDGTMQYWDNVNKKWADDNESKESHEQNQKNKATRDAIAQLPIIGPAVVKMSQGIGILGKKLFGKGEDKEKKGLFTKLFGFLSGENGAIHDIFQWVTGGTTFGKGFLGKLFSKISFKTLLGDAISIGIVYAGLTGKLDNIANRLGLGGKANNDVTETVTDSTGTSTTTTRKGDINTFGQNMRSQTARTILIGKGSTSLAARLLGRTKVGKAVTEKVGTSLASKGAANFMSRAEKSLSSNPQVAAMATKGITNGIFEKLKSLVLKLCDKVPALHGQQQRMLDFASDLSEAAAKPLAKGAGALKKVSGFMSSIAVPLRVFFVVSDFTTGYEDAANTLKIKDPSVGYRIVSGLLRAIKNAIPVIGMLIPDSTIVNIAINYIAPILGLNVEEFKKQRSAAQAEVDEYNKENGTNYSWTQYNKTVRKDYTWTERVGNAGKSIISDSKAKIGGTVKGIKEKGLIGYTKSSVADMVSSFQTAYKEKGGGVAGVFGGLGTTFQKLLPGVIGEIAKKNMDIKAFAAKGDLKALWGVSLSDFSKGDDPNTAAVGPFSTLIGQIPLIANKIAMTPFALIAKVGKGIWDIIAGIANKIKSGFKFLKDQRAEGVKILTTKGTSLKDLFTIKEPDPDNPMNGFMKAAAIQQRIMAIPTAILQKVGNDVSDFFNTHIIKPTKTTFSQMAQSKNQLEAVAMTTNPVQLWKTSADVTVGDGPFDKLISVTGVAEKAFYTIPSLISWTGRSIGNFFNKHASDTGTNVGILSDELAKIAEFAANGDVGSIWKEKPEFGKNDILSPGIKFIYKVGQVADTLVGLLVKVFGPVKNLIDFVGEKVSDFAGGVVNGAKAFGGAVVGGAKAVGGAVINGANGIYNGLNNRLTGGGAFVSQKDSRYSNISMGDGSVGDIGCGPASAVMALKSANKMSSMGGAISMARRYQTGSGTDAAYFGDYFSKNGANANYYSNKSDIINSVAAGGPTILMGRDASNVSKANSPFGPNNHYVVANGFDRHGNVIINDPESKTANKKYSPKILNNVGLGVGVTSGAGSYLRRRLFSAGGGNLRVDEVTKNIWSFFRNQGYTEAATAGIMGNMQQESGCTPTAIQKGGDKARGLVQWAGGRLTKLLQYASGKGKDWTDLQTQLEFVNQEVMGIKGLKDTYKKSTDVATATQLFETKYERAGKPVMENRIKYAKYYYEQFTGKTYAYNSTVGAALIGSSTAASLEDNSSGSSSNTSGESLLSSILGVFGKIGNIFSGNKDDSTSTDSSSATTTSADSTIGDSNPTGAAKSSGIVGYMKSKLNKLAYSQTGARNPDKGSADCSSTVEWAVKKATGIDIGSNTGTQYNNANLKNVWYNGGKFATATPKDMKENDILFYNRGTNRTDGVGHVEVYAGNNQMIGHGGGKNGKVPGPTLKPFSTNKLIKVARVVDSAGNSGLLTEDGRVITNNNYSNTGNIRKFRLSGGASGTSTSSTGAVSTKLSTTSLVSGSNLMSKDTAALLKVIITLVENLVTNTTKIDGIYGILSSYLSSKGVSDAAATVALSKFSGSTDNSKIESSLADLKNTVDSILAS